MKVMNDALEVVMIDPVKSANAVIIWLHGLGASGNDLVPIAQTLKFPSSLAVRHVFPHAPIRPVTLNNNLPMRAWFDIPTNVLTQREDEHGIKQSAQAIAQLIQAEQKRGFLSEQIVLGGFSQGGAMALHVGLTYPEPLAAIIALSSFIPLAKQQCFAKTTSLAIPIFMATGTHDPLVQYPWALASKDLLVQYGFSRVSWHTYPMEHQICPQEISDLNRWLDVVLTEKPIIVST